MEEERRLIVWNTSALDRFADELERLSAASYTKAEEVEAAVLNRLQQAVTMPERYAKDKYKRNNPGHYRAFETDDYRVSYRYDQKQIRVLRIRHVRQKPLYY
ncbi:type II toxin-antitoxin system RelE/ParE family toxin [Tunicatimonas pelagia]|uniref:type II toxin-antitoxin system RelE/ParE family toxin n=1 Tax=Tunicatimonas pelagia TaxID=931531 RepID=UPI002664F296|nr:type II toxin-antitoxin system RelE/ParE family toxin [Tunicatimonas pelagia]WKN45294.1 type II toxin-antitoxin system RelE/ParE family toxin [Tunicatimonas pelagia]